MSLPLRLYTDACENLARWMDAYFAAVEHLDASNIKMFPRASAHNLSKAGDTNPHQFSPGTLFGLFSTQPFVVNVLHRQL